MRIPRRIMWIAVSNSLVITAVALATTGSVTIKVTRQGTPVAFASVDVLTSDGVTPLMTDDKGVVVFDAGTRSFKVRVNGQTVPRVMTAADDPALIDVH